MGSKEREIKSPEVQLGGNSTPKRGSKKLGIYFLESDDRRTAFGRGYSGGVGGATPVNIHGKPIPPL